MLLAAGGEQMKTGEGVGRLTMRVEIELDRVRRGGMGRA